MIFTLLNTKFLNLKFDRYSNFITKKRMKKIQGYQNYKDKILSLGAELLLNYTIKKWDNSICLPVNWETDSWGKPYLSDYPDIYFNLSHSGEIVVAAISQNIIGIDIEQINLIDYNHIVNNYFHPKEAFFINYSSNEEKLSLFYSIWVLKESYLKSIGKGLSCNLDSFYVLPYNPTIIETDIPKEYKISLYHYHDYKIGICEKHDPKEFNHSSKSIICNFCKSSQ